MASSPRESAVEAKIVRWARDNGYWTRKFASPARRGVPDRVFLYKGHVLWLEVKRKGEKPTALQLHELAEIIVHGGMATWCDSAEDGISYLKALQLL